MEKCKKCGNPVDLSEIERFYEESWLFADNVNKDLCRDCLEIAWEKQQKNIFYQTCEKCEKRFDVWADDKLLESKSDKIYGMQDIELMDIWRNSKEILCGECALKFVAKWREKIDRENRDIDY